MSEREELARALRDVVMDMDVETSDCWLAAADVAIARCARVPRITREHYDAAYQRAVDASVRGEATVKEALYRELGAVPRALPTREALQTSWIARRATLLPWDWALSLLREHASPADEADKYEGMEASYDTMLSRLHQAERERDEARAELGQVADDRDACFKRAAEARAEVAKLETVVRENMRKADDHRRQRDEARAYAADLEQRLAVKSGAFDLSAQNEQRLAAQLAARPEPVVIDEALAERVYTEFTNRGGCDPDDILAALRSVLGDKVSVAGPEPTDEGDHWESLCQTERELREGLEDENRDLGAQRDKLRAELQTAQSELAKRAKVTPEEWSHLCTQEGHLQNDYRELREQHEALRAASERLVTCLEGAGLLVITRELRALLKPSTPEAQSWLKPVLDEAHKRATDGAPWPRNDTPEVYVPSHYAPVPASLAPLTARLDRVEAALRALGKVVADARDINGYTVVNHRAVPEALAMLDAGKQEVGE